MHRSPVSKLQPRSGFEKHVIDVWFQGKDISATARSERVLPPWEDCECGRGPGAFGQSEPSHHSSDWVQPPAHAGTQRPEASRQDDRGFLGRSKGPLGTGQICSGLEKSPFGAKSDFEIRAFKGFLYMYKKISPKKGLEVFTPKNLKWKKYIRQSENANGTPLEPLWGSK